MNAMPGDPLAVAGSAAISPATNVPWPSRVAHRASRRRSFAAAIRPANSGWPQSMPESITATLTGASSRRRRPEVEGVVLLEVPLLRGERLGVVEARTAAAGAASASAATRERDASRSRHRERRPRRRRARPWPRRAADAVACRARAPARSCEGAGGVGVAARDASSSVRRPAAGAATARPASAGRTVPRTPAASTWRVDARARRRPHEPRRARAPATSRYCVVDLRLDGSARTRPSAVEQQIAATVCPVPAGGLRLERRRRDARARSPASEHRAAVGQRRGGAARARARRRVNHVERSPSCAAAAPPVSVDLPVVAPSAVTVLHAAPTGRSSCAGRASGPGSFERLRDLRRVEQHRAPVVVRRRRVVRIRHRDEVRDGACRSPRPRTPSGRRSVEEKSVVATLPS